MDRSISTCRNDGYHTEGVMHAYGDRFRLRSHDVGFQWALLVLPYLRRCDQNALAAFSNQPSSPGFA